MTAPAFWNEGWTAALVNHLWQSMVVVGLVWLLAFALRKNHARVRYCVWMAASVKFLFPFSLLMTAGEWLRSWVPAPAAQPAVVNATEMVTQPFAGEQFFDAATMATAGHHANWMAVMLLAVWICGASVVAIRARLVESLEGQARGATVGPCSTTGASALLIDPDGAGDLWNPSARAANAGRDSGAANGGADAGDCGARDVPREAAGQSDVYDAHDCRSDVLVSSRSVVDRRAAGGRAGARL